MPALLLVFVVGADKTAQFREVKPGVLLDGMRVVTGVKPGELIIVDGLQRAFPGAVNQPVRDALMARQTDATPHADRDWVVVGATPESARLRVLVIEFHPWSGLRKNAIAAAVGFGLVIGLAFALALLS